MILPAPKKARSPKTNALYRDIIAVDHDGEAGGRTVRIATYAPRHEQTDNTVTFGIGYRDPDKFSKIFFEVTETNWKAINASMKRAFAAAKG